MIAIGTIHYDIEGPKRLEHLLERFKPKIITVEYPHTASLEEVAVLNQEAQQKRAALIPKMDLPQVIKEFLTEMNTVLGYDILIPLKYAEEKGAEVYGIDHPNVLPQFDPKDTSDETFFVGFSTSLKESLGGQIPKELESMDYTTFRAAMTNKLFDRAYHDPTIWKEIERQMSEKQRQRGEELLGHLNAISFAVKREQTMADEIEKREGDMHIGGLDHIFDYFPPVSMPLYLRVGTLFTQRIRLCDAMNY